MFREFSVRDINITHDLSKKISVKRNDRFRNYDNELYITSKIEMRNNSIREVH